MPDNSGYMVAAYAVTGVILTVYLVQLLVRASRALRR